MQLQGLSRARGRARCQSPKGGGVGGQNLLAQKGFSGRVVICSPVPALSLVLAGKKRWTLFFADITHVSQLSHSFTDVSSLFHQNVFANRLALGSLRLPQL